MFVTLSREYRGDPICDEHGWVLRDSMGNPQYTQVDKLGYAAEYNPNSEKCNQKNIKQLEWAYYNYFKDEKGDIWVEVYKGWDSTRTSEHPNGKRIVETHRIEDEFQPIIVDNIPRQGFKVADTVSRYSTSNKLWRILDPYGFELEISTANMEELIYKSTLIKGEFEGMYYWDFGKNGIGKAKLVKHYE